MCLGKEEYPFGIACTMFCALAIPIVSMSLQPSAKGAPFVDVPWNSKTRSCIQHISWLQGEHKLHMERYQVAPLTEEGGLSKSWLRDVGILVCIEKWKVLVGARWIRGSPTRDA